MDARGGTITWYLTANDADFNSAMMRTRASARSTGRAVERDFGRGMKSAQLSLDDFRQDLNRSAQVFRDFQIALRGFQMTSLIIGATLAGGAIVELVGALFAASGAIFAIPGMLAPAIGAFATLKTATYGVSDAFSAVLKGDMKKLAEEMDKLSPKAQEFVTSFGKINEAFKPIRTAVQDAFFDNLGKQMESVANVTLPVLRDGMLKVSVAMNGLVQEAARVAKEPFFQGMIADSLATTAQTTNTLTKAVEPLASALAGIVKIGLPYTNMLAEWVVSLSESASGYVNSADGQRQLTDTINLGIEAFQRLGTLLSSVFDLFIALFKVSNQEGLSMIDTLIRIVDAMTEWINSAQGQEYMTSLFEAANTILWELAQVAGDFLLVILGLIDAYNDLDGPAKDVITNLIVWSALMSPILTYISAMGASWKLVYFGVREVGQAVSWVITRLAGAKAGLTGLEITQSSLTSFDKLKLAGTQVGDVISGLVTGIKTNLAKAVASLATWFTTTAQAGGVLGGILNGLSIAARAVWAAITGPVGIVILIISALVLAFVWLWNNVEGFRNFWIGLWDGIQQVAQSVGAWFAGPFASFFTGLWAGLMSGLQAIGDFFATIWNGIVFILTPVIQLFGLIGYAIQAFWTVVFTIFSAIGQIIWTVVSTIVQILGAILYGSIMWIWNNVLVPFGQFIATLFNGILNVIKTVFTTVANFITTIWNGIMTFLNPMLVAIANIFTTVFNSIANVVNSVFQKIKVYIINPITEVVNYVGRTIGQIATFISNAVTNAYNAVAGFVGRFTSAGRDIIDGIVKGIKNGSGAVVEYIKTVCSNALSAVKNFFGIKSPSRVMAKVGGNIMAGLGLGIDREGSAVVSSARTAAEGVLDAFSGMQTGIGNIGTDFSINGNSTATTDVVASLAPSAIQNQSDIGSATAGAVIYQTNEVHTDLDMDQVNRNLTWELGKL